VRVKAGVEEGEQEMRWGGACLFCPVGCSYGICKPDGGEKIRDLPQRLRCYITTLNVGGIFGGAAIF